MIRVAVIGCGYWGPNLVRNFSALPNTEIRVICDRDEARAREVGHRFPAARLETDAYAAIAADDVDAVAVATPVQYHYPLARAALESGKHVLVEKPLTDSVKTARVLVDLAEERGLVLQVDHTFVYSGAVKKLKSIVDSGEMGDLLYVDCVRINLGLFQSDVNVIWDLAPHDVSIVLHLIDRPPVWVSAIGCAHYGKLESQAYVTIKFDHSLIAHLHVNWLAPVKIRSTLIGGSKRMLVYDDLEPSEKVRVYDKGVTLNEPDLRHEALVDYRLGDMFAPYIEKSEPLATVCATFVEAIQTGGRPMTDGIHGLEVVRILEAAQESIHKQGEQISLGALG